MFTTAASDMETVAEAVRSGAFDYLVKPIAYERLGQTLTRYQQRRRMLASSDSASQKQIDEMFNAYARGEPQGDLPTGIDALTLNAVMKLFADPTVRHTAETVAQALTISRTTSRRYRILRESAPDCRRDYSWQSGQAAAYLSRRLSPG